MTREQLARSMAEADADMTRERLISHLANIYLNGIEPVTQEEVDEINQEDL